MHLSATIRPPRLTECHYTEKLNPSNAGNGDGADRGRQIYICNVAGQLAAGYTYQLDCSRSNASIALSWGDSLNRGRSGQIT